MTEKMLLDFIRDELNKGDTWHNATAYLDDVYGEYAHIKVTFERNHSKQYAELLKLCAENNGIIISTNPGTYSTIIRVRREG